MSLMKDAGVEHLSEDASQKFQDRFRLDLSDEDAEHFFLELMDPRVAQRHRARRAGEVPSHGRGVQILVRRGSVYVLLCIRDGESVAARGAS
jgi:hypothetical protein